MTAFQTMRTTSFRLEDELLGEVNVWRASQAFAEAWLQLTQARRPRMYKLPYGSLVAALSAMTGDFVTLQEPRRHGDHTLISRQPVSEQLLRDALAAWEVVVLGEALPGALSGKLDGFRAETLPVAAVVQRRANDSPLLDQAWAWEAARWEVAHRLQKGPLQTDAGPMALRLDTDAALLTWDSPISSANGKMQALHRIRPRIITVPGVAAPVVHLESSLVRLSDEWRGQRNAWVDVAVDRPLHYLEVGHKRVGDGFQQFWRDGAAELLRYLSLEPLPDLDQPPTSEGRLRAGFRRTPRYAPIGRGVGPWFHEYVARHAYSILSDSADPLIVERWVKSFPTRPKLTEQVEVKEPVALHVVYANADTRQRIVGLLPQFLRAHTELSEAELDQTGRELAEVSDNTPVCAGPFVVRFFCPPQAAAHLLGGGERTKLDRWLASWLPANIDTGPRSRAVAALIETIPFEGRNGVAREADPKHLLRGLFAARGVVTQFITQDSVPSPRGDGCDHAGLNALRDLLRSAGVFLWRFPCEGVEKGALLVGVHCQRVNRRRGVAGGYLPSLVAVTAGSTDAWGYTEARGWLSLGEATAHYWSQPLMKDGDSARQFMERAVAQLRVQWPGVPIALFFDAIGCRRFWNWLQDKGERCPAPWAVADNAAVIRVRSSADEVPRLAGRNDWAHAPQPVGFTSFCPVQIVGADGPSGLYMAVGTPTMDRTMSARASTRYKTNDSGLRSDWHSLSMTEFLLLRTGSWTEGAVRRQALALCRGAPTWDQALRWPVPLHLARAIVQDHPLWSSEDAEQAEL